MNRNTTLTCLSFLWIAIFTGSFRILMLLVLGEWLYGGKRKYSVMAMVAATVIIFGCSQVSDGYLEHGLQYFETKEFYCVIAKTVWTVGMQFFRPYEYQPANEIIEHFAKLKKDCEKVIDTIVE